MARMGFETARAVSLVVTVATAVAVASCGGAKSSTFNGKSGDSVALSGNGGGGSGSALTSGSLSGSTTTILPDGAVVDSVPDPNCPNGGNTTVSGIVYDPALQNPLYNITVFIPNQLSDLPNLNSGASCAACADYYPANIVAAAGTDVNGHFTITRAANGPAIPVGKNIPIVVQTGKWRMAFTLGEVTACQDNVAPDKTLRLPAKASEGNLPDIAISTGGADSLECLPLRIGIDSSEYVAGGGGPGHLHIFQGAGGATMTGGTPRSSASLWDSQADLMKNDVVLLSCEGAETTGVTMASRTDLEDYANSGGRVFASHFHYSWFNQPPFSTENLATWTPGANALDDTKFFPGAVVTTLNSAAGGTFPEGVALGQWLGVVNALDANGLLDIWYSRHNADVSTMNTPSQPWIVLDKSSSMDPGATQYFSWDTPVGTAGAEKCGRVVYSDLHVSGGPGKSEMNVPADYPMARGMQGGTVPGQCAMHPLTPQEKALEFMLFDLSSCLIPVGSPPTPPITPK
jgi:hypothetical protein